MSTETYKDALFRILEELKKLDVPTWGKDVTVGITVRTENGDTKINFDIDDIREVLGGTFVDYGSKFKNGDIVTLDPAGLGHGVIGKVLGVTKYHEGDYGYVVSAFNRMNENLSRHYVAEEEIMRIEVRE